MVGPLEIGGAGVGVGVDSDAVRLRVVRGGGISVSMFVGWY